MRLLIAAALPLAAPFLAAPAQAQQLDIRRIDVRPIIIRDRGTIGGYHCRFAAAPNLQLYHALENRLAPRAWNAQPARETREGESMTLDFAYYAVDAAPFGVSVEGGRFSLKPVGSVVPGAVSARLTIDGADPGIPLRITTMPEPGSVPPRHYYLVSALDPAAAPALRQKLQAGSGAALDLFDRDGTSLYHYSWDLRVLRVIPQMLDLVDWSCTTPDAS